MIMKNAVGRRREWREANTGVAFKPIQGAAPQFQIGDLALPEMLNCNNDSSNSHNVNCGV